VIVAKDAKNDTTLYSEEDYLRDIGELQEEDNPE